MRKKMKTAAATAIGLAAIGGSAGLADAAKTKKKHTVKHQTSQSTTTSGSSSSRPANPETPLTGDTKTKAEAAAQAAYPDAKIWRSSTEDPSDSSGAAYEVHMTKADGSEIEVLEDSSFKVIATEASRQSPGGRGDHGRGGPGGSHNETALTGDTKTQAEAAAKAKVTDATVERSSAEDPNAATTTKAAYEVHMRKSDGTEVTVLEDSSFSVLSVETHQGHDGGPHGDG